MKMAGLLHSCFRETESNGVAQDVDAVVPSYTAVKRKMCKKEKLEYDFCYPQVLYVNNPELLIHLGVAKIAHRTRWSRLDVVKLFRSRDIL